MVKYLPHIISLVGLVLGLWWFGHSRYEAGQNDVQAKWDRAIVVAQIEAKRKEDEDAAATKALQDELVRVGGSLDAATARGRILANRLSAALSRPCLSQAPSTTSSTTNSTGVSDDSRGIEQAFGRHIEACARDAVKVDGWQMWWKEVGE